MFSDAIGPQHCGGAGTRQLREQGASREPEQQPLEEEEAWHPWHTLCQECRERMEDTPSRVPGLSLGDGRAEPAEEAAVGLPPELAQYPVMFVEPNEWMILTSALEQYWRSRHSGCHGYSEN